MGRPARTDDTFPNRIRELRLRRGLTLEELANQVGLTKSALGRIETGQSQLKFMHVHPLAVALDVDDPEIVFDLGSRPVPIIGGVIEGGRIEIYDPAQTRMVECPRGLNPLETEALQVLGNFLPLIEDQSILFVGAPKRPHVDMIGMFGVASLSAGAVLVCQLRRGYSPDRFNLLTSDAAPLEDVELASFSRITMIGNPSVVAVSKAKAAGEAGSAEDDQQPRRALQI